MTAIIKAASKHAMALGLVAGVGYMLWLSRLSKHGAHTDGIAFAILLGNLLAPLFDRCFRQQ